MSERPGIPVDGDVPPPLPWRRNDDAMDHIIPVKNPPALASYYLGWLSLLPVLGVPFFLFAIIFGIKGLSMVRKTGSRIGQVHAVIGLVFGMIAIPEQFLSVLLLLASFA
jgi:hypothetical protein